MSTIRLLKYDIRQGFRYNRWWYLLEAGMTAGMALYRGIQFERAFPDETFGWLDLVCFLLRGEKTKQELGIFRLPAMWLFLFVVILILLAAYPRDGLSPKGMQVYVRSRTPGKWWLCKCLWMLFSVTTAWAIFYGSCFLVSLALGWMPGGRISPLLLEQVFAIPGSDAVWLLYLALFLMPPLVSLALGMSLLCLQIYIHSYLAYIGIVSYLFFGVLFTKPYLLGNYAMLIRYQWAGAAEGVAFLPGAAGCTVLFAAACVLGAVRLRKYSVLR